GIPSPSETPTQNARRQAPAPSESVKSKANLQRRKRPRIQENNLSGERTRISVGDKKFLHRYYRKVFRNLQQTNCRIIAKAYVKLVEPRKQTQYPYNGRKVVAGKTYQLSPEETKPPWWPLGVSHREPDHLLKAERIALLLHILCELHTSHGITARKLRDAEQHLRRGIFPIDRLQLLDELYSVREQEEKFIDGINGALLQTIVDI
ncbi:hypothetical protein N7451_012446, partial [Penicillium sp. IBT 35674x]